MADNKQDEVPKLEQEEGKDQAMVVTDVAEPIQPKTIPPPEAAVEREPVPVPETEEELPLKANKIASENDHQAPQAAEELKQSSEGGGVDDTIKVPVSVSAAIEEEIITKIANLKDSEKTSLLEFKLLVREALKNHEFGSSAVEAETEEPKQSEKGEEKKVEAEEKTDVAELGDEKNEILVGDGEKIVVHDSVDDDGAKTLEAIEETIVAVSSSAPHEKSLSQNGESEQAKGDTSETKLSENDDKSPEEVSIWGVKLLEDDRSDVILLKFLRARDFRAKEALTMLKSTIRWRKEFGIDELVEQDLSGGDHGLEKVVFMHGLDKEGNPVCYNVFGEFQRNELYEKTFSDEEKRQRFLRWRIQFLERSIRKLDFNPDGISTIVQVNDLKNSPGPAKKELRLATKQALQLLQDNYPEFVARQIFINVPWWYLTVNRMISPFLTQRTRSKFIFAGPSKSADTLFRYISAEQVPVKYGGMSKGAEFGSADAVTEISVKPAVKHSVEIPVTEKCVGSWEVRVVGWDQVRYGAEFVPAAEGSYTTIIQKPRLVGAGNQDEIISNSFKIGEPGKLVLTIDNTSSKKKKKFLYRFNSKSFSN